MSHETIWMTLALLFGFYAAWNIGANDVANAMGTSVGSRALTLRQAVILAAIFEFLGAVFFGSNVSETLQKGLLNTDLFELMPLTLVRGMLASLLATGLWLQFASWAGLPVSTTHSIVGAIVGFGCIIVGVDAVNWENVVHIAFSWIASPLLGASAGYLLFTLFRYHVFYKPSPLKAMKALLPFLAAAVVFVLSQSMLYQVLMPHSPYTIKFLISFTLAALTALLSMLLQRRIQAKPSSQKSGYDPQLSYDLDKSKKQLERLMHALRGEERFQMNDIITEIGSLNYKLQNASRVETRSPEITQVERIFGFLQVSSACLMAFAHGSNDVSNAIGPMAAIISTLQNHFFSTSSAFPMWALILGASGIVIGLATWGWRVIETVGKRITELTPSRGFSAEFGAALTILLASRLGFPVSTTHTIVGAVFGVGLAGGLAALNTKTLRDILLSWFVTLPMGALLSILCYSILVLFI